VPTSALHFALLLVFLLRLAAGLLLLLLTWIAGATALLILAGTLRLVALLLLAGLVLSTLLGFLLLFIHKENLLARLDWRLWQCN
jgi:hypothetical protein